MSSLRVTRENSSRRVGLVKRLQLIYTRPALTIFGLFVLPKVSSRECSDEGRTAPGPSLISFDNAPREALRAYLPAVTASLAVKVRPEITKCTVQLRDDEMQLREASSNCAVPVGPVELLETGIAKGFQLLLGT